MPRPVSGKPFNEMTQNEKNDLRFRQEKYDKERINKALGDDAGIGVVVLVLLAMAIAGVMYVYELASYLLDNGVRSYLHASILWRTVGLIPVVAGLIVWHRRWLNKSKRGKVMRGFVYLLSLFLFVIATFLQVDVILSYVLAFVAALLLLKIGSICWAKLRG